MHVSSNTNNGTNAGTFYLNANNSSANANRNIGVQFAEIYFKMNDYAPLPERANTSIQYSLVGQPKNWEITGDEAVWELVEQDY